MPIYISFFLYEKENWGKHTVKNKKQPTHRCRKMKKKNMTHDTCIYLTLRIYTLLRIIQRYQQNVKDHEKRESEAVIKENMKEVATNKSILNNWQQILSE